MKKGLALFDFDGTITSKDTLLEIIKYQKGNWFFLLGMVVLSPVLVLYKLKVIPNWRAKQIMLAFFFGGDTLVSFNKKCDQFVQDELPKMLNPSALKKIDHHKNNNDRIVVVTASPGNWIKAWCEGLQIELISTELEVNNGKVTGRFSTYNCYGQEKVNRIRKHLEVAHYTPIYAYGDSPGDRAMLSLADFPFYRQFFDTKDVK